MQHKRYWGATRSTLNAYILSAKSVVLSSLSTDFHRQNENMRYTVIFSEYLIEHLLEIEEFSQNRQKM